MAQNVFLNIKHNTTYAIYFMQPKIGRISYMWNVGINRGINITKVFAMHIKLESIHGIKLSTFEKAMVFASLCQGDVSSTI